MSERHRRERERGGRVTIESARFGPSIDFALFAAAEEILAHCKQSNFIVRTLPVVVVVVIGGGGEGPRFKDWPQTERFTPQYGGVEACARASRE